MSKAFNFRRWLRGREFPGYDLIVCPETELEPAMLHACSDDGKRWVDIQLADVPILHPDYLLYIQCSPQEFIASITENITLGIVVDEELVRVSRERLQ